MLVSLTPNYEEIKRRQKVAEEHGFDFEPEHLQQIEKGIYCPYFGFNFSYEEFIEKVDGYDMNKHLYETKEWDKYKSQYGVSDNIEQIKDFYKEQIDDAEKKYIIAITRVDKDLSNKGKGGGWRWHKWGEYIGTQNPNCEYLDDEENIETVLCFHLYQVKN